MTTRTKLTVMIMAAATLTAATAATAAAQEDETTTQEPPPIVIDAGFEARFEPSDSRLDQEGNPSLIGRFINRDTIGRAALGAVDTSGEGFGDGAEMIGTMVVATIIDETLNGNDRDFERARASENEMCAGLARIQSREDRLGTGRIVARPRACRR